MTEQLTPEQVIRRMCVAIERCDKALGGDLLDQLQSVPVKVRHRLAHAVNQFSDKLHQHGIE